MHLESRSFEQAADTQARRGKSAASTRTTRQVRAVARLPLLQRRSSASCKKFAEIPGRLQVKQALAVGGEIRVIERLDLRRRVGQLSNPGVPFRTTPTPMVALQHRDSQVMPGAAQMDDRLPDVAVPRTDAPVAPDCCAIKSSHDSARRPIKAIGGIAVVQEDDAVVPQVAQGVLDVAHDLLIGVEPVDQGDVDAALLEEGRLVREEVVAGRLEVVGGACLRVGEPAGARRELERRVDGDLLVGGNTPERMLPAKRRSPDRRVSPARRAPAARP